MRRKLDRGHGGGRDNLEILTLLLCSLQHIGVKAQKRR